MRSYRASRPLGSAIAKGAVIPRRARARRAILGSTVAKSVPAQFRFAETPLADGIAPVGMTAAIFVPGPPFVDFGSHLDPLAGCGVA